MYLEFPVIIDLGCSLLLTFASPLTPIVSHWNRYSSRLCRHQAHQTSFGRTKMCIGRGSGHMAHIVHICINRSTIIMSSYTFILLYYWWIFSYNIHTKQPIKYIFHICVSQWKRYKRSRGVEPATTIKIQRQSTWHRHKMLHQNTHTCTSADINTYGTPIVISPSLNRIVSHRR